MVIEKHSADEAADFRRYLSGHREEDLEWNQGAKDREYEGQVAGENPHDGENGNDRATGA